MTRAERNRRGNIWTARIIPLILLGIFGYATWVVTKLVCVDYLLNPPANLSAPRRAGPAIAVLVIYFLLGLPVLICYARLLFTILTNPGYVPRGAQWHLRNAEDNAEIQGRVDKHRRGHRVLTEKAASSSRRDSKESPSSNSGCSSVTLKDNMQPRVEDFWMKNVFICNFDGRPSFCSHCLNFKPDRAHHCSEVNRCVRKMDHFCPWVGGIVSEMSFKFFIQFCFYGALFCMHTLVVMAYFFAQRRRREEDWLNINWALIMAFAALFLLFSTGMFGSTFQLALVNSSTIDNLSRKTKVYYLAVWMPRPEEVLRNVEGSGKKPPPMITYPRPPDEQLMHLEQSGNALSGPSAAAAMQDAQRPGPSMSTRTFAILETPQGFNPWDLGPLNNVKEVLGYDIVDWFIPLRYSPATNHTDGESYFKLGPQVETLKQDAGLVSRVESPSSQKMEHHTKRRRRQSLGSVDQNEVDRQERHSRRHSSRRRGHIRNEG